MFALTRGNLRDPRIRMRRGTGCRDGRMTRTLISSSHGTASSSHRKDAPPSCPGARRNGSQRRPEFARIVSARLNVQLRIAELKPGKSAMANGDCRNDRIAQTPGLSDAQMQKLALTYIAASVRAKMWLIPAYHATVDDGISNGHDDPQHFDPVRWGTDVCSYLDRMGKACS